ncbi:MAG: sensor histidine kinase [Magnetococcus sp. DMHC-8]
MIDTLPAPDGRHTVILRHSGHWRLGTRLIFWSGLLLLVSLGTIIAIILWGIPYTPLEGRLRQMHADTFRQLNSLASTNKETIENWLEDKQKDLQAVARFFPLPDAPHSTADQATIHAQLRAIAQVYPEFDQVLLIDLTGQTLLSSADPQIRPLVMDAFMRRVSLSNRGYMGRARLLEQDKGPLFRLGCPVQDRQGRRVALLVATLSPESLLRQLLETGTALGNSGDVVLVNDDGFLINVPRQSLPDGTHPKPLQHRLEAKPAMLSANGHEGIIETTDYRGIPSLAAFRHIRINPEWGMGLVVKMDQQEWLAPLRQEVFTALQIGLTTFALVVLLNQFMVRRQTGLLDTLGHAAARLADGDLDSRSGIRGRDEIGLLGLAFDRMADRVQTTMEQLRKEVSKQRRTAVELTQLNDELRNFIYIVSHDLRSPLLSIQGFSEELQWDLRALHKEVTALLAHLDPHQGATIHELLDARLPEDLQYIRASTDKMEGLINAILTLSRLGRAVLHHESLDIRQLVEDNIQAVAHIIQAAGVTVTLGHLPNLTSDRTAMGQIVGNLLANAVKYLDPKRPGVIHIHGDEDRETGQVTLRVEDNGRGIAREDIPKIFVLFQRVGRQDTPGDGMGLACVQTWVRRLGGQVTCASTLGVGTVFSVTLPADPSATVQT